ncbi:LysR family transcriptional regulator [Amorphoplanes digitatis]|uniref:DNA-binding transcriptional LysR family regulator n=1 Tax=Actinoplanes digitatis TaxID=1868 RepID=A0A7W7I244_9ACTN|nr:LysR family transcriptional regulator [Actinoplanes digitatis]MBB4765074.1 DNA-binding transcriptional LysR family regulator [Actinoplanes digitatis]GID97639.1 LysR family transcriptional regulator [Actinoplanes digitatis]
MEMRHLRYFVVLAEECHFGRAAKRLHMAQSPLSHQIRQLEDELGVALFQRTTRRVALTAAGERYLERVREVLRGVEVAGEEARRIAAGDTGHLAIGFTGSATYEMLPTLSRDLRNSFPGIELDLKGELLTPDQVAALLSGELDVGFLRPPVRDPGLDVHVLRSEPLIVALPVSHPLAHRRRVRLEDLDDEDFISYPSHGRSVVHDLVADACRRAGFTPRVVEEVAETSTIISFVAAGLGVALVPASVANLRVTGARYRPLVGDPASVELAVAIRVADASPLAVKVRDRAIALTTEAHRID